MHDATAIGIDVGGTQIRAARISGAGDVLDWAMRPTAGDPAQVAAQIGELVQSLDRSDVAAVGVGVPGRVDARQGRVLSGGYVDLAGVPLAEALSGAMRRPVFVDNDGNMALYAEHAVGAARTATTAIMFTIGTGIGGAVVADGRLLRGRASAGQLGHMTVVSGGKPCLCGRRGCVETTSSGTALAGHIAQAGFPAGVSVEQILALAGEDKAARTVLAAWAAPMRVAIDTAVAVFDPELVLLGGGLGSAMHLALAAFPAEAAWYQCSGGAGQPRRPRRRDRRRPERACPSPRQGRAFAMKRVLLVNGVPASGKSTVARAVAEANGWPLLTLDTVKEAFFDHLGTGDRDFSRLLGKASYQAIFALIRDFPDGTTAIVDAWFGFQPLDLLERHLASAGRRPGRRDLVPCAGRHHRRALSLEARAAPCGPPRRGVHPGADRAGGSRRPLGSYPVFDVDTTRPLDLGALKEWLRRAIRDVERLIRLPAPLP